MRTLLISASWEPISFIDERRVISLIMRDRVDIVSSWDEYLIPQRSLLYPATVRLRKYVKIPYAGVRFSRYSIFVRDDWRCQYCGSCLAYREATVDHVVPRSRGGKSEWTNCVTACKPCNTRKDNATLDEAGLTLMSVPFAPTHGRHHVRRESITSWHSDWDALL